MYLLRNKYLRLDSIQRQRPIVIFVSTLRDITSFHSKIYKTGTWEKWKHNLYLELFDFYSKSFSLKLSTVLVVDLSYVRLNIHIPMYLYETSYKKPLASSRHSTRYYIFHCETYGTRSTKPELDKNE